MILYTITSKAIAKITKQGVTDIKPRNEIKWNKKKTELILNCRKHEKKTKTHKKYRE